MLALHVVLMSGRCVYLISPVQQRARGSVSMYQKAWLGLPKEKGVLQSGTTAIRSLRPLELWKLHDLTLILRRMSGPFHWKSFIFFFTVILVLAEHANSAGKRWIGN